MEYDLNASQTDYLTGLANRRGLYDYYAHLPSESRIHAMYIDIDNFKRVNDIFGHNNGDLLLSEISRLLFDTSGNFTARIGGDEYVIIFNSLYFSHSDLTDLAKKMIDSMQGISFRKDILSLVSLSIGIVYDQNVDQDLGDILNKCDAAMYNAKNSGKNRFSVYNNNNSEQKLTVRIEKAMESALLGGQFVPFFIPRMNMLTMQLIGVDTVSRWIHTKSGIILPEVYLPVFNKNGFIKKLDMYIIEELCRKKSTWKGRKYEHLPISVSISRLQFFDDNFVPTVLGLCDKYDIAHEELEFKISEGIYIKDIHEVSLMINTLKKEGFGVSVTDFGAGFSALSMLQSLNVDAVKMSKEFVGTSTSTDRGRHVIRNIISLCKDLKLDVIADGIKDDSQANFIMTCGCSIGQGPLYSLAVSEEEFCRYAEEYYSETMDCFRFSLDGTLDSEDGAKTAVIVGEGLKYEKGIFKDSKSLFFPGGPLETNCVIVPDDIMISDSFTISMWIKPKENRMWSSALYVKFETGFCSVVPMSPDSHSDFRIRDSREVSGWYDLVALTLQEDKWYHYVVTYNARTERAISFVNGEVAFIMDNVPTNRYVKLIYLGGDVFQPSFVGNICEVIFYNESKDYDFVSDLHKSYVSDKNFTAFQN